MARSVNKVTLIGTLGRDPEVRYMPNGTAVANISLATDESYNDKATGQKVEQTEWHRLTVYGRMAEICQQYLKKGSKAYFEGKLRTREWEKDGIKRYTTEIICNDMMMLDARQSGDGQMGQGGYQASTGQSAAGYQGGYAQPQSHQPQQSARPTPPPSDQAMGVSQGGRQGYGTQQPQQQSMGGMGQGGYQQPQQPQQPQQQPRQAAQQPAPQPSNRFDDFDDDIPF